MARKCAAMVCAVVGMLAMVVGSAGAATVGVDVSSDQFTPKTVRINQGDTITWTWVGGTHNVTSTTPAGVLRSGNLSKPATYSHTFTETPGTYQYECTKHGGMVGTITVVGADSTPPPAPSASPPGGAYNAPQSVTLRDSEAGATIRYTIDGSTPTTTSTAYSGPISVASSKTIKALAVDGAGNTSPVTTAAYTIDTAAPPAPTASPAPGTYADTQNVSLADAESAATIRYTTDGSAPDGFSTQYSLPITVDHSMTIRAIALDAAGNQSPAGTFAYTIDNGVPAPPTAAPAGGTYRSAQSVRLTGEAGTTLRYTTDGSTPTAASTAYSGPIAVDRSLTLKAIAIGANGRASSVATQDYVIDTTAPPAPTASPAPGAYRDAQDVTLADADAGATIHYTTDGSAPTATSPAYTGPVHVASDTTVRALAVDTAGNEGPAASFAYTIDATAPPAPTADPAPGRYDGPQDVRLTVAEAGAAIHYTTDGSAPDATSPVYGAPIHVTDRATIKAVAIDAAGNAGELASFGYVISAPAAPTARIVGVGGYDYAPRNIIVNKGETVTWTWNGPDFNHTVTSDPGQGESFESHPGVADAAVDAPAGGRFEHRFDSVGSYGYFCRLHPEMRGTVTVVESGAPADQPADNPPGADASSAQVAPSSDSPPPAAGARTWSVDVANMEFGPSDVTVEQGDAVTWRWTGADTNHSVTSSPGQPETFESHPGVSLAKLTKAPPGGTFTHTFTQLGTTTYFCRLHPDMKGVVRVVPRGAAPPTRSPDLAPLRVSKLTLTLKGRRLALSLTSSATARLSVQIWGRTPGSHRARRLRAATLRARRGTNRLALTLPASAARRGTRLRALVLGSDAAGNATRPLSRTIRAR